VEKIRFGVIGLGNMGSFHVGYLDTLEGASLAAVCDTDEKKRGDYKAKVSVPIFATHQDLLESKTCDAIIIATPHYDHPPIAIDAFKAGVHVLCEKPVAVSVKAARELNAIYEKNYRHLKFGLMFNQRTLPAYQKLRELISSGELGEIFRVTWLITDWFRTWTYYASGGWRATWAGEGGGVLINQCPHNLDLLQWIVGMMPTRVTAVASIAKTHPIEVEDEVSAILEFPNGAIGHFVTTTGEFPGTNRLEIACDRGRIIAEHNKLIWKRARETVTSVNQTSTKSFANIETWEIEIPLPKEPKSQHIEITRQFVQSILTDSPLGAEGVEGVRGLELGNAMLMAGLTRKPVELPMDGDAYDQFLLDLAKQYGGKKTLQVKDVASGNMAGTFGNVK